MARDDYYDKDFDFEADPRNTIGWQQREFEFIERLPNLQEVLNDDFALRLIDAAYITFESDTVNAWRQMLADYWTDTFGYDFDEYFDWESWREWVSPT